MRFRFQLEPVLEVRKRAEEEAQRAVAALERQRLELEETLRRRQEEIRNEKDALRGRLVGELDVRGLRLQAGSSVHLVRKARQAVLALAGLHRRMGEARAALVEAARRRRAMELLRERRYGEWKAGLDKTETAELDEISSRPPADR